MVGSRDDTAAITARDRADGDVAIFIIDVINDLSFPDAKAVHAAAAAGWIARLREDLARANAPIVVNDDFSKWHSEKMRLVDHAIAR